MSKYVGYSLSRCVVSILTGEIKLCDIQMIIARTCFDPENPKHREDIWKGYTEINSYSNPIWYGYKDRREEIENIYLELHRSGRLLQPRRQGTHIGASIKEWESTGDDE